MPDRDAPPPPGEILQRDILAKHDLTQQALADAMQVSRFSINQIVNNRRSITPEMALRLGRATASDPNYWLDLQMACDLYAARMALRDKLNYMPVLCRHPEPVAETASRAAAGRDRR